MPAAFFIVLLSFFAYCILFNERRYESSFSKKLSMVKSSFGEHPTSGNQVDLFTGRYGPYIKHGKTNATVPKGMDPEKLTTEEALAILVAKEGTPKKKAGAKKAAKKSGKKSVVRKKAAKKSPAKSKSK